MSWEARGYENTVREGGGLGVRREAQERERERGNGEGKGTRNVRGRQNGRP
jgi:hypothetical protein